MAPSQKEARMPNQADRYPPNRGPRMLPLDTPVCIMPMPQPIRSFGRLEETRDMAAGTKPLMIPARPRTRNNWNGVCTTPSMA